jgi:hypothetical protein
LKKATKTLWILFACFVIGFPIYVVSVGSDLFGLFGGMPSLKSIENPENDLSSELISADGVSLGRYFRYNRSQVTYSQLSPDLVNTLLYLKITGSTITPDWTSKHTSEFCMASSLLVPVLKVVEVLSPAASQKFI